MHEMTDTVSGMNDLITLLRKEQSPYGSWNYPFETGISTDAYMIILLRTLEIHDENLIQGLAARILRKQEENGAWKIFEDETDGNATATLEAYYGLLYSGYIQKEDSRMKAARKFILEHGGMESVNVLRKLCFPLRGNINGLNPFRFLWRLCFCLFPSHLTFISFPCMGV